MTDNVTQLHKLLTAEQVLEHAQAAGLKHVIVAGVTESGDNYFKFSGCSTLKDITWTAFCVNDSVTRMIRED